MTMTSEEARTVDAGALRVERWAARSSSDRISRATLTLQGGGHRWRANADGNGAVDALMRAADRALEPLLAAGVELTTYEVHATGPGHDTKAAVAVSIRARDDADGPLYPGRAVDDNVLEASLAAYVDAINTLLADRQIDVAAAVPSPGDTARHDADRDEDVRSRTKQSIMTLYNG